MRRVLIIAPISALSKRTRIKKIAKIFHESGFEIFHLGWERKKGEREEDLDFKIEKKILINGGGYGEKFTRHLYILWLIKVSIFLIKRNKYFTHIYCLGLESALPAVILNFKNKKIIFDDADRLILILSLPKLLKKIVEKLEKITSKKSFVHIIPNIERYPYNTSKMVLLKNTPDKDEFTKAKKLKINFKRRKLNIYINGWLGKIRGIPIFLEVAKRLESKDIAFLLAGRNGCEEVNDMIRLKNVFYLGNLKNYEALAYYKVSDLVVTFYDPNIKINQYAEANKWGDAIFFNVPVLVNSEVKTANFLRRYDSCFSFKYKDVEGITKFLIKLIENKEELYIKKRNISKLKHTVSFFDERFKIILKEILN
ncbi:glycosyltransferase family protein [Calditrichota bacterium GD2]